MPRSFAEREAARKRAAAKARKDQRQWVAFAGHPNGGFWYAATVPASKHGVWNTYNSWYCRCWDCTEANLAKKQKQVDGTPND